MIATAILAPPCSVYLLSQKQEQEQRHW